MSNSNARPTLFFSVILASVATTLTPTTSARETPPSGAPLRWVDSYPPGFRSGQTFASNPANGRLLMFGGVLGSTSGAASGNASMLGDLWEWDGASWRSLNAAGPIPRRNAAAAFNPVTGRMMLFGGMGGDVTFDAAIHSDTWEWDGVRWSQLQLSGPLAARDGYLAMAIDRARGVMVLLTGPQTTSGAEPTQTWEWSGEAWVLKSAGNADRFPRGLAHDPVTGSLVTVERLGNTSETRVTQWTGTEWVPATNQPGWTNGGTLLPDVLTGELRALAFSPSTGTAIWKREPSGWTVESTPPNAGTLPRLDDLTAFRTAVWDSIAGRPLAMGSAPNGSNPATHDTYHLETSGWVRKAPAGPGARLLPGVAEDPDRGVTVVFGSAISSWNQNLILAGNRADTWEFADGSWQRRADNSQPVPTTSTTRLWFDTVARTVSTVVGPVNLPFRRWDWNGSAWTRLDTVNSPIRLTNWSGTFHEGIGKFVMISGRPNPVWNPAPTTWLLSGDTWEQLTIPNPPARLDGLMAYDSHRQRIVLFGGDNPTPPPGVPYEPYNDTWEFDGTSWTRMNVTTPPPQTIGPGGFVTSYSAMAYDAARRLTVMLQLPVLPGLTGLPGTPPLPDTAPAVVWEWDGVDWNQRRPVQPVCPAVLRNPAAPFRGEPLILRNFYARRLSMTPGFMNEDTTLAFDTRTQRLAAWGGMNILHDPVRGPVRVAPAYLEQMSEPGVFAQPARLIVARAGRTITIDARIALEGAVFRWHKDGVPLAEGQRIIGTDTEGLAITNTSGADAGWYHLVATGAGAQRIETLATQVLVRSPADFNADGLVNSDDLTRFLGAFGRSDPRCAQATLWDIAIGCEADLNNDGVVNTRDLVRLLGQFGAPTSN
ncbi:MAG: hypothetical protein ACKVZJ_12155 [Phycisphaerales bacterium]